MRSVRKHKNRSLDKSIKLLIAYHNQETLLKDDIFTPIHVGRALARKRMG